MLSLLTLFLFLLLLPGIVPPAAAQPALSLQPSGVLIRMGHIVPTEVYFDSPETDGLNGVRDVVASGDLLFVTAFFDDTLSVWRVNAEAGTLSQTVLYRDNTSGIDGLDGAAGVAISDDGKLLFVTATNDDALSVWRVNEAAESLEQIEVYLDDGRDGVEGIDGLDGANDIAVSGNLLFVTARDDAALSAWQVNAEAGALRRTALHRNRNNLGTGIESVAVSDNLLFVAASGNGALSVWQVNAEAGTLMPTGFYRRVIVGDPGSGPGGLSGAFGVAASGDGNLLFVTGNGENTLSVWRVNAEEGTLTQTVFYRNRSIRAQEGIPVDGLFFPRGVAVSGNLLFVTGSFSESIGAWQINAEAGTLRQAALYQDIVTSGINHIAEVDGRVDGLRGAWNVAVSDGLLFVTTFDEFNRGVGQALSVWHINNAEVSLEMPTVISMQLDLPVDREVMVTVTAQSGAEMVRANPVTLSTSTLSERAVFPPGTLGLGRWVFTAQVNLPTVLDTGAARTAVQVVPLLSLESRQEQYAVGNTVTLTVRASPALQVVTSYRIIARRIGIGLLSIPELDSTITHSAGSTEVTVLIPGQSLSTGQWEFSIQLLDNSPFRVGDSVTAFISTPTLSLQPSGVLIRMGHIVPTGVYFDSPETDGLNGVRDVVASGDLLFVTGFRDDTLSVWRVNAEAGTLSQTVLYRDNTNEINGLDGAAGVAISDDGKLLFVAGRNDDALSVWRVNEAAESLEQIEVYLDDGRDGVEGIDGLDGANDIAVSGNLLFVTARDDAALSAWQVDAAAGTLRRTALHRNQNDLGTGIENVAVSDNLVFVTGTLSNSLSVWQVNAEVGTLMPTGFYRRLDSGDPSTGPGGLFGAWGVAASGDGNLLFVTGIDEDTLGVWRVNAEVGTLTQTVFYRDSGLAGAVDGIPVDGGLFFPRGVAVSGNLLFVTGQFSEAISAWQINAEAGTLRLASLYQDIDVTGDIRVAEADGQIDGLEGAWNVAVSDGLLFVTTFDEFNSGTGRALSVWHINNAEVSLETPTVISMQLDLPVDREVMVTVTAHSGAEMVRANPVTLSASTLSGRAVFPPGALGLGRWVFTAQVNLPTVLDTGAARTAVQVVPLLSLESRQEQFAVGNTVILTVRASAALQVAASYRIIARRIDPSGIPEEDFAITHSAGSTEVTVRIPGQRLSTGQWEFSIQLPDNSPFRVGGGSTATAGIVFPLLQLVPLQDQYEVDSTITLSVQANVALPMDANYLVVATNVASGRVLSTITVEHFANTIAQEVSFPARLFFIPGQWEFSIFLPPGSPFQADSNLVISLPAPVLSLQPEGMLTRMGHAVLTGTHFNLLESRLGFAVSGNLLFVTSRQFEYLDDALSVWRVNAEAGTLSQTVVYRNGDEDDGGNTISGLRGASGIAASGNLLFVAGFTFGRLSVFQVNETEGTLRQTAVYRRGGMDNAGNTISDLSGPSAVAVSGDLLFVSLINGDVLSVWQVNEYSGTLRQTAVYRDSDFDGLDNVFAMAVSDNLLFVTANSDDALSAWQINAEEGTLIQTDLHRDGVNNINGLDSVADVAVSGDGDLLFVTANGDHALSVWRINTEEGTLRQAALYQDGVNGIDGLMGARSVAVSGDLLFVVAREQDGILSIWQINAEAQAGILRQTALHRDGVLSIPRQVRASGNVLFVNVESRGDAISVWHINNARVLFGLPVMIRVQPDMPVREEVVVTVTARNGAEMARDTVSLSPEILSAEARFASLGPGRWIFTAQAEPPALLNAGAARIAVQVAPLLSLELRREQFVAGNTITLTVRASAALQVAASYHIIARRIGPPSVTEVDFAVTHPAGSTEVTVLIPGQSLSTGQWKFSIRLPAFSPFQAGDSVTAFISTPALSLQLEGMLSMMEHAVPTELYFDSFQFPGLSGLSDFAISGDLLFVTAFVDDTLSVWRVNAEAGTLSQTVRYRDNGNGIDGLNGAASVAVSDDGDLLFVTGQFDGGVLSVWQVNRASGILRQTEIYRNGEMDDGGKTISGLSGAEVATVSGDFLFVASSVDDALSVWQVNESSGTLRQTAVYRNSDPGASGRLNRVSDMAVSYDLLFVTASDTNVLSAWRINAEGGTLTPTDFHRDNANGIDGLGGEQSVAVSGDLLFVAASFDNALSVWRINAEAGTLRLAEIYREGVSGIDGLGRVQSVAVSGDLLFVVAREQDGILSIWRINAEAQVGILRQTVLYRDGVLPAIGQVGVGGNLLFVTSRSNSALSVWHINNAEVPFGAPVMIRVQSDIPVLREVVVTMTARNGAEEAEAAFTLSPDRRSAEITFRSLSPGRQIFTAQAQPPALLDTGAARIAMQVLAPVELTLDVPGSVTVGDTFTVTVGVAAGTPLPESVSVTATLSFSAGDGEEIEGVVLTSARSSARATFTAPDTAGRYTVAARGIRSDSILLPVVSTTAQVTVQPFLALDVPSAPIYRGVMFPVRVRLLGGLLEDNGSVAVTVYLRNAVTHALASTATATLSTAAPSDELRFEATPGEAVVTAYSLTIEDIDQRLAPLTRAVLSLQSAAPATVFITRINADLSGDEVFDADDAVLIARGLLTRNYLARSAGGLSQLGPGAFQARLSELADFADISGDGRLNIIDLVFLTRNADATVSDLQSRVNAGDNPFAYLCGSTASNACEGIGSRHQNITLPGGIQYEAIGEVLDSLRRVPQPPMLPSPNNP